MGGENRAAGKRQRADRAAGGIGVSADGECKGGAVMSAALGEILIPALSPNTRKGSSSARDWMARILIPLLFFAATAPTLPWVEFAGGAENIVVATALEMRRSGQWLIPTLAGERR